jgi:hypothetical protein
MEFSIQVSNPRISGDYDPEDVNLDECIQTSFVLNTEMAFIEWQGIFIPLTYKYSISIMLLDILILLQELLDKQSGELDITWPTNEFSVRWIISWQHDSLTIEANWKCVIGKTEELLNNLEPLRVNKYEFIYEWRELLSVIINGLAKCGYNESNVSDFIWLKNIHSRIDNDGILYTK